MKINRPQVTDAAKAKSRRLSSHEVIDGDSGFSLKAGCRFLLHRSVKLQQSIDFLTTCGERFPLH